MNVGDSSEPVFRFDGFENFEPGFEAGAAVAADRCAVGLIKRTLEEDVQLGILLL